MQKKQNYLLAIMMVLFSISISYSQTKIKGINGRNKSGKVYYKSGKVEEGKLSYGNTGLIIKFEDKNKKKVEIKNIKKFGIFRKKKDSVYYTWVLSKRNAKKKNKKKYLCELVYEGKKIKIYNEPVSTQVGILSVTQPFYFIQKTGDPYAVKWIQAFKNANTMMKEHFKDCPSLTEKIGTEGYKMRDIKNIAEYYEANCEAKERKRPTREKNDLSGMSSEEKRANQIREREAKKKALDEKRKKVLEERAIAKQKRLDSIKKAREK